MKNISTCCFIGLLALFPGWISSDIETRYDTLVICPADFQPTLQPWLELRKKQGHRIQVVAPKSSAYETRKMIHRLVNKASIQNLMLVGDSKHDNPKNSVPTDYVRAKVNSRYGSAPEIASDNAYSDIDGDDIPDLSIGRLAVDNKQQLATVIDKIIRYEKELDFGKWRRQINLVAGVGGFGSLEDDVIEKTTKHFITELIPPDYQTSMTYASWASAYCPDPRQLAKTTLRRLNEGCLFWVYIGHGHYQSLDQMRVGRNWYRILDQGLIDQVKSKSGLPIAIFLACYTGGFDYHQDCLAEELLCCEHGPVACLCGTRVTMPYAMGVLSLELMEEYFRGKHQTLGQLMLAAKRNMMNKTKTHSKFRKMIEVLGKTLSPTGNLLEQERKEHVHMVHLLGDPLLRLKRISPLQIKLDSEPTAGSIVTVSGVATKPGEMTVELVYRRDRFRFRPERRKEFVPTSFALGKYQTTYEQANHRICVAKKIEVVPGAFSTEIEIPENASGNCYIRAYLQAPRQAFAGSVPINLK